MVSMIVLDVDGTLSDGKLYLYNDNGSIRESKSFDVKDGMGIKKWIGSGRLVSIISGRNCNFTRVRFGDLGVQEIFLGVENKIHILDRLVSKYNLSPREIACIGDDENDLDLIRYCERSFAPSDAVPLVRDSVKHVLHNRGGHGAVREMIEILLSSDGNARYQS